MTGAAGRLGVALVALAAIACGPELVLSYEDLIGSGRLAAIAGAAPGDEHTCADETRFAVVLDPGADVRFPLELGADSTLGVAGCLAAPPGTDPGGGTLELEIQGVDGLATQADLPVDGSGWAAATVELEAHAEARAELRLRLDAPSGTRLFLADLFVRHRVAPAAGRRPDDAGGSRSTRASGPSVLLISVDTLRADAVGAETPGLAGFAAAAETWSPHYSTAPWTKPSHASLLTGYPVEVHGARFESEAIDPAIPTLAGRFRAGGYRTAGLVYDCEWLDAEWGFDRGFDEYQVMRWGADPAVRATADWIAERRHEPFFYFLHLFTPHSDKAVLPYEAAGVDRGTVAERFGLVDYGCRGGSCASQLLLRLNQGLAPLPAEDRVLRYLYDRGVATTDAALSRLFQDLEAIGILDEMVVVVTSDHGEAFFEHGKVLHSTVHREVIEVPLMIRWPGRRHAGLRRSVPSSSIDLAPTLLAAAGVDAPDLPGTRLAERQPDQPIFAGTTSLSIVAGDVHAIFDARTGLGELYDLRHDPGERFDLSARSPEELLRLRDRILGQLEEAAKLRSELRAAATSVVAPEVELTEEELRRLKALGYVQ